MAIYIPKKDYGRRKRKYTNTIEDASRIPFGGNTLQSYYIYPSFKVMEEMIDKQLRELLDIEKPCLDSQNGNVLDKMINSWFDRVIQELDFQKVKHNSAIQSLIAIRASTLENAKDLIALDKERLKEIEDSIQEDEIKFKQNII